METNKINRWKIKNHDLKVGDFVKVDRVRSNHLDTEKGIGWFAENVVVCVTKVTDLTFWFEFNNEKHSELKNDVSKVSNKPTLFSDSMLVQHVKDTFEYRMRTNYQIF